MLIFSAPRFHCPKFSSCGLPHWDTQHIDRERSRRFGRLRRVWSKTANVQRPTSNVQHRTIGEGSGWLRSSVQGWKLSVGRWTFVLAFLPTYPRLPAVTCLHRYHTRLSPALSCHPYSVVKCFASCATSSEAVVRLLNEPAEASTRPYGRPQGRACVKKHAPPLLGRVYTFALKFLYNSTSSKDTKLSLCKT